MLNEYQRLSTFFDYVRKSTDFKPKVALILGSGLNAFVDNHAIVHTINFKDIPGFPVSTAPYHIGRFVFTQIKGVPTAIMQGRLHYYEGYAMNDVVAPVRLLKMLGAEVLFLTNAAGSVNLSLESGDLVVIEDHISHLVPSPLRGANIAELGARFSDMSAVYDEDLQQIIHAVGKANGIATKRGVYLQTAGPQFETPAEIRLYRSWGADIVGMSTTCEAIAAKHMNMKVCALSCVTNLGAGISKQALTEEEVALTATRVAADFNALIEGTIEQIGRQL
ncbi:MAG: purine-nucleoside phosphorylase [Clostridiales bacterium]|nr:MAG: purine-nucleoside phosphorylase [Clostridiales bacterium]